MSIDSLDGPVTSNEINSFVSYINSINPVVWPNTGSMENQYAQGASGEQIKAMGLMYEISGNTAILNRMMYFCDTLLSQRNDILASPNGQRVYWNGKISPAWPGQALGVTPVYSTSASGDCVGHLANCARLILQTPAIWNTTVPDGDPFGYGATYLARAKTYVQQADYTFTNCFFTDMLTLTNSGLTNVYCYPTGYPYQGGNQYPWNQAMMMTYPLQNLAIAHSILGDNPSLVSKYDNLVQTNVGRFFTDPTVSQLLTDSAGNLVYDWAYNPSANAGEDSNHGSLDVAGFYRAYATNRYGITASQMKPFANMVVDIMTLTIGSYYAGTVDGCTTCTGHAATTTYLRSGFFLSAEFRPDQYYNMVTGLHITAPGTTGSIDAFSRLMWIKNKRYLSSNSFTLAATPSSQSVTAGNGTSYTVTVTPTGSFSGTVNFSVSGLPTGASASFNPTSVTTSGSSTMSVTTSTSTPAGTYSLSITGTSGTNTQTATVSLAVSGSQPSLPAGWSDTDIGAPSPAGSASYSGGTFTDSGSGSDIWGTADQLNYAYTATSGDTTITARVATLQNTNAWAKAGVMFRESTAAGASYIGLYVTPGNGVSMQYRNGTGTSAVDLARITGVAAPYWVRLVRSANTFTGYASPNGTTWTQVGSIAVTMASGATAGLPVCSHSAGVLCTATEDNVSVTTPVSYTITASAGTNGSISPSGSVSVGQGASQTFTISPSAGYQVSAVTVDGTSAGAVTSYTFSNVQANHTISASFVVIPTYTITASAGTGGTISPTGSVSVTQGANQSFTIAASSGYSISSVTVDGTSVGAVTSYTFSNVQANHTISASFAAISNYTITASAGTGGTISPSGSVSVTQGGNQAFTIAASSGYTIASVTVDGTNVGAVATYTFSNVQANHTIAAAFNTSTTTTTALNDTATGITYTGTWNYGGSRGLGDYQDDVHYTATNGDSVSYTFTGVGIDYVTEKNTDEGNIAFYIDGVLQTTVNCSNSTRLVQQVVYSASGLTSGSHTLKAVKQDGTYMLLDELIVHQLSGTTYTVTASAGTGGTITPSGSVSVAQGANQTFTIAANSGYTISAVTVDGASVGAVTSYTFSNVQANHTISASFSGSVSDTNIAPNGTAYGWNANTSATANTNKSAQPGLNDNNLTNNVDIDSAGDAVNAWEAAGVTWTTTKTISSADFINGDITTGGDGYLTASLALQFTTDGSTWTNSGWTVSPAYPYSSSAGGQTYTFSGTAVSGVLGARLVGQVRTTDTSYHWIVKEVQFIGH